MEAKTTTQILLFMQLISGVALLPCHAQTPGQMSKMWFNMESAQGAFSQTLLAYSNFTTDGIDFGYDGTLLNNGATALYTKVGNTKLMIQAKGDFTVDDVEALHYRADIAGEYTIKLHNKTGVFTNGQNVYLRDNQTGTIHDFSAGVYTFTAAQGTTEGRFDIIYLFPDNDVILTNKDRQLKEKDLLVYRRDNVLIVTAPGSQINEVRIFDISGRLLYKKTDIRVESTVINIEPHNQMLIVQTSLTGGGETSKKVIY